MDLSTLIPYFVISTIALVIVVSIMVRWMAHPSTPYLAQFITWLSWFLTFSMCLVLPYDLLQPQSEHDQVETTMWTVVYWSGFLLTWAVLPLLQDYYGSGEFDVKSRIWRSIRVNLLFYAVVLILFVAFLIYLAATDGVDTTQILGFIVCLGSLWGVLLSTFLLGYGLVEVPRTIYRRSKSFVVQLKLIQYKAVDIWEEREDAKETLYQTIRVLDHLRLVTPEGPLRRAFEQIDSKCPPATQFDLSTLGSPSHLEPLAPSLDRLRTIVPKDISTKVLVPLHEHVIQLSQTLSLTEAQWRDQFQAYLQLERLIALQKENHPPLWRVRGTPVPAQFMNALRWRWNIRWKAGVYRIVAIITALFSAAFFWSELTLPSPIDVAPFGHLLSISRSSDNPLAIELSCLIPLSFLCLCAFFATFRLRFFNYYHMHGGRRTEGQSLLFNGGILLRIIPPLALNYLLIVREKNTAFEVIITAQMNAAVPYFGSPLHVWIALLTAVLCVADLLNLLGRIARLMGIKRFEYTENFQDEKLQEGASILQAEARRRRIQPGGSDGGELLQQQFPDPHLSINHSDSDSAGHIRLELSELR